MKEHVSSFTSVIHNLVEHTPTVTHRPMDEQQRLFYDKHVHVFSDMQLFHTDLTTQKEYRQVLLSVNEGHLAFYM